MDLRHIRFEGSPTNRVPLGPHAALTGVPVRGGVAQRHEPVASGLPARILARHGLNPALYRHRPLERRISACLRALKVSSETAAWACLDSGPDARRVALNALLIGVSAFFRDAAVFDTIQSTAIEDFKRLGRPPRVWSAGCSTGAELYSIAMMLARAGIERAELLGTDCRPDAVVAARRGVFESREVADLAVGTRDHFFEQTHAGWCIVPSLRRWTTWEVADATRDRPNGQWDLVLCRNLVIYLHDSAGRALLRQVAAALAPGGFLVVGKAERPPETPGLRAVGPCTYRTDGHW